MGYPFVRSFGLSLVSIIGYLSSWRLVDNSTFTSNIVVSSMVYPFSQQVCSWRAVWEIRFVQISECSQWAQYGDHSAQTLRGIGCGQDGLFLPPKLGCVTELHAVFYPQYELGTVSFHNKARRDNTSVIFLSASKNTSEIND